MERKRIVLLSHNDLLGGAAIVTYRLMKALQAMGHEADMLVFNKISDDPHVHQVGTRPIRGLRFMKERIGIMLHNGFNRQDLFKVSTGSTGMNIHRHPLVKKADAIFINWINQATVSLSEIRRLCKMGKPVVWTMHDMWCMTGICHHAYGCANYHRECGDCQYLGSKAAPNDLSHKIWRKKKKLYDNTNIKFVAVSNWVKERAKESSLLRNKDVTVIHNAFPSDMFTVHCDKPYIARKELKFDHIISFGAAKLDDPVKGLSYAIDALNILMDESPDIAAGTIAVFFGETERADLFQKLRFPHIACGTISDHTVLHQLLSKTDVILSTSLYETLGGTLIEGMSAGATPVSFGVGGQPDIIDHKSTGYIAEYRNPHDVANGIRWALSANLDREHLHHVVRQRFNAESIARKYLSLIE